MIGKDKKMGKYFGTDGFRGEAGSTLTSDHAYKVGRFLGWCCQKMSGTIKFFYETL